jgi:hypothetical protein
MFDGGFRLKTPMLEEDTVFDLVDYVSFEAHEMIARIFLPNWGLQNGYAQER